MIVIAYMINFSFYNLLLTPSHLFWVTSVKKCLLIYPESLSWHLGARSFWRNTSFSLDIGGRALVLPLSEVSGFVDSPWEGLSFLRSG